MAKDLLTDRIAAGAKAREAAYRLNDGAGLVLWVSPTGAKTWQYRYRHEGKGQLATLGRYPAISLAQARELRAKAREAVRRGVHLTTAARVAKARKVAHSAATFGALAAAWVKSESRRARWTPDYREEVEASLRNHLAALDPLPVADVTAAVAAPLLRSAEARAPDMATKVRARLRAIMDHACEDGLITANPIPPARRRKGVAKSHLPAILTRDGIGAILRAADTSDVSRGVRRAHLLCVYTAQRIGEIVGASWDEIDLKTGTWSIPRERMKRKDEARGPHVVPLPPRLLAMMVEWRRADGDDATWVCPAPSANGAITSEAVEKFYRRGLALAGRHSPHGWRSVFSTWCRDAGKDADVIEAQLDHVVGNKVAASYDRSKRIELRRALVTWYEGELVAARDGARVLPIKRGA
ncbi:MAG: tyrosine-type recombinase/integrase [Burkholderiales bacterium]|nr:tyrosine-type recombinase/integrase [Burkholderiales bacterium]